MAVTKDQVIEFLSSMTVMDMANLVKELEDKWGVEAAPAAVAAVAAPAAAAEEKEEQTEFDVVIKELGPKKIEVIKAIRAITSVGLKEAKDMAAPGQVIKTGVPKDDANDTAEKLKAAGATVEIK